MAEINLFKNGDIIGVTIVDSDDFVKFGTIKWFIDKDGYVYRRKQVNKVSKRILLHREIVSCPDGYLVDHINHNTLDNRKENLRICTSANNNHNRVSNGHTSQYKGVYWNKKLKRYQVKITMNSKLKYLGVAFTEEYGALLYNRKATQLHGEFACLNKLPFTDDYIIELEKLKRAEVLKQKTSKYVGIKKQKNRWIAYNKQKYIGSFLTEEDALMALLESRK